MTKRALAPHKRDHAGAQGRNLCINLQWKNRVRVRVGEEGKEKERHAREEGREVASLSSIWVDRTKRPIQQTATTLEGLGYNHPKKEQGACVRVRGVAIAKKWRTRGRLLLVLVLLQYVTSLIPLSLTLVFPFSINLS